MSDIQKQLDYICRNSSCQECKLSENGNCKIAIEAELSKQSDDSEVVDYGHSDHVYILSYEYIPDQLSKQSEDSKIKFSNKETNELFAKEITEQVSKYYLQLIGESSCTNFNTKTDIYMIVDKILTKGIEI